MRDSLLYWVKEKGKHEWKRTSGAKKRTTTDGQGKLTLNSEERITSLKVSLEEVGESKVGWGEKKKLATGGMPGIKERERRGLIAYGRACLGDHAVADRGKNEEIPHVRSKAEMNRRGDVRLKTASRSQKTSKGKTQGSKNKLITRRKFLQKKLKREELNFEKHGCRGMALGESLKARLNERREKSQSRPWRQENGRKKIRLGGDGCSQRRKKKQRY